MPRLRVALCQLNTVVGDLDGNVRRILAAYEQAEAAGADLAVFPELAITGYPAEDLLLRPGFVADNRAALDKVAAGTGRCVAFVGFVDADRDLRNAAAVCADGAVVGRYHKRLLPNYAVFDEQRYFTAGVRPISLFDVGGVRVGVSICEDAWAPTGPIYQQGAGGAELVVNLNASPYYRGRHVERERMIATRAEDGHCAIVYVNQVGGQDELVFDGGSFVVDDRGELVTRLPQFQEQVALVDVDVRMTFRTRLLDPRGRAAVEPLPVVDVGTRAIAPAEGRPDVPAPVEPLGPVAEVYEALVLGTRDYVHKNGFTDVVIGLSGGIDSSLVTCIAADALGADHVYTVAMPSRFSSEHSRRDAGRLAANLAVDHCEVAIEPAHAAFREMLTPVAGEPTGLTDENLQPRVRGTLLMALTNANRGWLVLTTGNKSELAVGYSTLYGDTAGGFAVISDVPKLLVYDLCRLINERAGREIIPESVLTKPPSAELRPDQRDDQSLPPYEALDPLLAAYVEEDMTRTELVAAGHDAALVERITRLVDVAEYKRRQNPPGPRISAKAFGKDRRMPITNGYDG
ncbi:MAG: NAD+ synthase [Acidimicrobiia bacterium]|nr:NAD+ synthase [Acidimicrobiia bacterium]